MNKFTMCIEGNPQTDGGLMEDGKQEAKQSNMSLPRRSFVLSLSLSVTRLNKVFPLAICTQIPYYQSNPAQCIDF